MYIYGRGNRKFAFLLVGLAVACLTVLAYPAITGAIQNYNRAHQPQVMVIGPNVDPAAIKNVSMATTDSGNGEELTPEEDAALLNDTQPAEVSPGIDSNFPGFGGWVRVTSALQSGTANDDAYKMFYQSIYFHSDGTYTWEGWHFGAEFKKRGTFTYKSGLLTLKDTQWLEGPEGLRGVVWMDETSSKIDDYDGLHHVSLSSIGNADFVFGVTYNRGMRDYFNFNGTKHHFPTN